MWSQLRAFRNYAYSNNFCQNVSRTIGSGGGEHYVVLASLRLLAGRRGCVVNLRLPREKYLGPVRVHVHTCTVHPEYNYTCMCASTSYTTCTGLRRSAFVSTSITSPIIHRPGVINEQTLYSSTIHISHCLTLSRG